MSGTIKGFPTRADTPSHFNVTDIYHVTAGYNKFSEDCTLFVVPNNFKAKIYDATIKGEHITRIDVYEDV